MCVNTEINGLWGKVIHSPLPTADTLEKEDVINNKNNEEKPKINASPVEIALHWNNSAFSQLTQKTTDFSVASFPSFTSSFKKKIFELFFPNEKLIVTFLQAITFWFRLFWEESTPTTSEEGHKGHNMRMNV